MSSIILDPFQRIVVLQPTFSISPNITSVDEGNSVVFTVVTEFFGSGTLFFNIEGVSGTITADDFTTPLSGSVAITDNLGTITVNVKEDYNTEGSESFKMNLRTTSTNGPIVAVSAVVTINDTSINPLITPPEIPDGGPEGASSVKFNPSGTRVAWAHRILSDSPSSTIVSLYNFSSGNLTKVQDFVNAQIQSSIEGTSIVWLNNTTLFVSSSGGVEFADRGIMRWTLSGSTFVKTHQNTNFSGPLALTPFGLLVGNSNTPRLLSTSDLTQIFQFTSDRPAAYCAYSNNTFVFGSVGSSSTNNNLTVWNRNSSGVFTKETTLPPFVSRGGVFPSISGLEFNGNTLLVGQNYGSLTITNPVASLFQRNGVNNWTLLHQVPMTIDPGQGDWSARSVAWRNSNEFAIGRFVFAGMPSQIYRYSWNGSTATRIQEIPSPGGQPLGINYHPSQPFIAVAVYINQPFFRVYSF